MQKSLLLIVILFLALGLTAVALWHGSSSHTDTSTVAKTSHLSKEIEWLAGTRSVWIQMASSPPSKLVLEINDGQLRIASSPEKLAAAEAIEPASSDNTDLGENDGVIHMARYPVVTLTFAGANAPQVHAEFSLYQITGSDMLDIGPQLMGSFTIEQSGDAGGIAYTCNLPLMLSTGKTSEENSLLILPNFSTLKMEVVAQMEESDEEDPKPANELGTLIGLKVQSGEVDIDGVTRDGQEVPARIEVMNTHTGQRVLDEIGNLEKFGFT